MPKKLTTILPAQFVGQRYVGYVDSKRRLLVARRDDRTTKLVRADRLLDDLFLDSFNDEGQSADSLMSLAPGAFEGEMITGRVLADDMRHVAIYA
jgi:hypothetical protein